MKQEIYKIVAKTVEKLGITRNALLRSRPQGRMAQVTFKIDYPDNLEYGDFSCNVAMVYAKQFELSPKILAEQVMTELNKELVGALNFIESISVAGPGFINFKMKDSAFANLIVGESRGSTSRGQTSKKVMVEYTDPNPFKVFHIGHLMSNAIGESISRLIESGGAEVIRACYQGDVGLHVAKTIWAIQNFEHRLKRLNELKTVEGNLTEKLTLLGNAYMFGASVYDDADLSGKIPGGPTKEKMQSEINVINKKIFEKSDPVINEIYDQGRKWSLEYFDTIYKRLDTEFTQFFFESEVADDGIKVVREFLKKGVFAESKGAVVFKGEDYGLHTRVFITSHGLPTYEAKEIGLNIEKFRKYSDLSESVIITANEQNDYFKVLLKAFSLIDSNISDKTKHISHGIMRFASGKMSSRKGNIISAEELIADIRSLVVEKIADREFSPEEKNEIADIIAIGAIKYTILRQATGGDVIFDSASSISFEGDSGPYLQYAVVRANAILVKSEKLKGASKSRLLPDKVTMLEKLLSRYAYIKERAQVEYAPQHIAQYLMSLAGAFNGYYAVNQIVDDTDPLSPYRVELTKRFVETMTDGLWLLGIKVPRRM